MKLLLTHEGCPEKRDINAVKLELRYKGKPLANGAIMSEWECPCGLRVLSFEDPRDLPGWTQVENSDTHSG